MAVNTPTQSPAVSRQGPEQQGLGAYTQHLRRVSRPGPDADAIAGEAGSGELQIAAAAGPGTDAGVPGDDAVTGGRDGLEAYLLSLPLADPEQGRERDASSAAEPRTLLRSRGALRGVVLGRMVYEQRTSRGRAAVDGSCRATDLNEGTIKWRVPDGQAPGLAAQGIVNTGTVRPETVRSSPRAAWCSSRTRRTACSARNETNDGRVVWERELDANPEGSTRSLRSRRPSRRRLCRGRVVGFGNRSRLEECLSQETGQDRA